MISGSSLGPDTIKGGSGNDSIIAGGGNDVIHVGRGTVNEVHAGDGDDVIYGGVDDSWHPLLGNGGNDTFYGSDANNSFWGGDGEDTLFGGGGDDKLSGDRGSDVLDGGAWIDLLTELVGSEDAEVDHFIGGPGVDYFEYVVEQDIVASDADDLAWGFRQMAPIDYI